MSKQREGVKVMKEGQRKESLKRYHESLNPFVLKEKMENGLRKLYDYIYTEKAKAEMEEANEEKTLEQ